MENFQLYRTNLRLGGQMKWDIILNSTSTSLYVSDFHLSPISNNVSHIYKSEENLLNNRHQDNVKAYYNEHRSNFYNEALNPEFNSNWPIICKRNEKVTCYSNMYDMGCKRTSSYNIYNKQFEFFCPLWIEHLNGILKFEFVVKCKDSDKVISKNNLIFDMTEIETHNKFIKYFNNYIEDSGLKTGDDNIINVNFKDLSCVVSGLNASTGLFSTKNVDSIPNNLILRERPLLEADHLIISALTDNSYIAKQLFNFNFCFNVSDILPGYIAKVMLGKEISINLNVYLNDTLLEKKDFYTEYEFIDKYIITNYGKDDQTKINVLDYLHDYESVELINLNKLSQNICHWSLIENNDYIFNVYDGFSGIFIDNKDTSNGNVKTYHVNEHQYCNATNTIIKKDDKSQNTTGWINTIDVNYWNDFYRYISNTDKMLKNAIHLSDKKIINNVKYDYIPKSLIESEITNGMYCIGINTDTDLLHAIRDNKDDFYLECFVIITNKLYMLKVNNLIIFVTNDSNQLAFANLKDTLYLYMSNESTNELDDTSKYYLNEMNKFINSKIDSEIITFGGGLLWSPADGPSKNIKEVIYFNDNVSQNYVVRYDGNIKPTFITPDTLYNKNTLYYKDYISDDRTTKNSSKLQNSKYSGYIVSGHEPLYPSINYNAINKMLDWNYNCLPDIYVSEHDEAVKPYSGYEYKWFETNNLIILTDKINFTCINEKQPNGKYHSTEYLIKEYLKQYYDTTDEMFVEFILSKYDITKNWEYFSNTNISDYKYNITLSLK